MTQCPVMHVSYTVQGDGFTVGEAKVWSPAQIRSIVGLY